jgi:hypothetical protein
MLLWYASMSNSSRLQQTLYQDMKDIYPYDSCFKALCSGGEVEPEAPNYPHLLESHLGRIYLKGQDYTRGIVSILEQNVLDPRYQNQKYRMQQMQPIPPCTGQPNPEQRISDSASDLVAIEERSTYDANQSTESIAELFTSVTPPPDVINREEQQLPVHAEALDLPRYTILLEEYSTRQGVKASYTNLPTQLLPTSKFICTITFQGIKVAGPECTSKKQAKHRASKVLWEELMARQWV